MYICALPTIPFLISPSQSPFHYIPHISKELAVSKVCGLGRKRLIATKDDSHEILMYMYMYMYIYMYMYMYVNHISLYAVHTHGLHYSYNMEIRCCSHTCTATININVHAKYITLNAHISHT